jgi:G3E family GTPase
VTAIPVSVLTGFLGSGKTTLLSRLLRHRAMARTAVIINEFGAVGLDHLLIERSDDDIVQLNSGCLCCTIRGDLVRTIGDLIARRRRGDVLEFERIVIETTGLADPVPILQALMTDPALAADIALDGVVTVVDAVTGAHTLDQYDEAARQVALADRLVVTKTDLADPAASGLPGRLRALNPAAPVLTAVRGDIDPAALFDASGPTPKSADARAWLAADAPAGHGHDVSRHGADIRSHTFRRAEPIHAVALTLYLEILAEHCGANLLRLKGLVNLAESPDRPAVIHGVQHVLHPIDWLDAWPSESRESIFVFITKDIPGSWLECLLDAVNAEVAEALARRENRAG